MPQIVTETLYALAVQRNPPFVPTEVRLLTTEAGRRQTELLLLDGAARFDALCADYAIARPHFDRSCIHVLGTLHGEPREDIRTPDDNRVAADEITTLFRRWADDPGCAIHASIAGGRKTMGYYLGYAASLFGRRQDRLSHVLVNDPFEQHPDFFYPPPRPEILRGRRDDLSYSTADARVQIADVPFIRLGSGMPRELLTGDAGFADIVAAAELHLGQPRLTLDVERRIVRCGGQRVTLGRRSFTVYAWLAKRRKDLGDRAALLMADVASPASPARQDLIRLLRRKGFASYEAEAADHLRKAEHNTAQWLQTHMSRINKTLLQQLGPVGAAQYGIASSAARGARFLALAPDQIEFDAIVDDTPT
ncbi:MAG TPA: CRISPR-associated ring nuclease Csm6 [Tahibacter sp.]|nr:CRISPR-associated ring nuclease Csm6 [Tahibacter sp.]